MPSFVALLKISGKVEGAAQRLQKLPQRWLECTTEKVIFGTGGYDAVVFFIAPDIVAANQYIDKYLRDSDPLTIIHTATGAPTRPPPDPRTSSPIHPPPSLATSLPPPTPPPPP